MDRRQRKTREAIFKAFTELLSQKNFDQITVGEIIESADIGRATFYSHFETKDYLLEKFCKELFCHIFDTENEGENDAPEIVFNRADCRHDQRRQEGRNTPKAEAGKAQRMQKEQNERSERHNGPF